MSNVGMRARLWRSVLLFVTASFLAATFAVVAKPLPVAASFTEPFPICAPGVAPTLGPVHMPYRTDCAFQNGNRGDPDNYDEWIRAVDMSISPNEVALADLPNTTFTVTYNQLIPYNTFCGTDNDPCTLDRSPSFFDSVPNSARTMFYLLRTEDGGEFGHGGNNPDTAPFKFVRVGSCTSSTNTTCQYTIQINYTTNQGWGLVRGYAGDIQLMFPVTYTGEWLAGWAPITIHSPRPTADFTYQPVSPAGTRHFVSTSTPGNSGNGAPIVDWEWYIDDGDATGTGETIDHTFSLPGEYFVMLTVTDENGLSDSVFKWVTVAAPTLDVNIEGDLEGHPVGEAVPVTVTVSASAGLGPLTDLAFVGAPLHVYPVASGTASALTPSPTTPFDLDPGQSKVFTGTVTFSASGTVQLSSTVAGTDAAGRDVSHRGTLNATLPALNVTVTGDPCVRLVTGDPDRCVVELAAVPDSSSVDVTLTVEVKNSGGDVTIENVLIDESLTLTRVGGGAADGLVEVDGPLSDVGPLQGGQLGTLQAGESRTVTYHVRASKSGRFEVEVGASGDAADTATGRLGLNVGESLLLRWEIEPRFTGPDDIADTPADANPEEYWFQATTAKPDGSECDANLDARWEVDGERIFPTDVDGQPCTFRFSRPNLDEFDLFVEVVDPDESVVGEATETVEAKDLLIASLGDSLSSGEGVPDGGNWTLAQCNRSINAGSAQAALQIEESDPHTSVTFVHLACSGADVVSGLLGSYAGIQPVGTMRQPQINQLRTIARERTVDALVMSIGINDIKFSDVIKNCIFRACSLPSDDTGFFLAQRLDSLPVRYSNVAAALEQNGITAEDVFLLEYPDATKDDVGNYCDSDLNTGYITNAEWQWAYENMMAPLNRAGSVAAGAHSWNRIGGLDAAFMTHGLCAENSWTTDFFDSWYQQGSIGGSFHPNQVGHGVYAAYIYSALRPHLLANSGGDPSSLPTSVRFRTSEGDVEIDVSDDRFNVGDRVTIAPGSDHQETRTITGKGSLILDAPLDFAHEAGEPIVLTENVPALTPTNRRPFATNDTMSVCSSDAAIDVLANDSDLDGDDLGIRSVSSSNAEIVTGSDGRARVAFHPPFGFAGETFTYEAIDSSGATDVGTVTLNAAVAPFSDVPLSHPFCADIVWMRDANISTGFGDGTYRPGAVVTRQAMSAFMARLSGATLIDCVTEPFADVPTSHPFCREIKWMKDNAISTGFGDGTYRPAGNVTRQAMSAFMARLAGAGLEACVETPFSDVSISHPFCAEIAWMKSSGVSTGFSDSTYRPSGIVTRQAMSAFMHRVSVLLN